MKLLPFNLQKAQAGHPWGTRDGRKGKKIFDTERANCSRLIALLDDEALQTSDINGNYHNEESPHDLFLYEETKKGWVVIYKDENSQFGFQAIRCTLEYDKEAQEKFSKANGTYHSTVEVEY